MTQTAGKPGFASLDACDQREWGLTESELLKSIRAQRRLDEEPHSCNDAFFVLSVNYRGIHGYGKVPLLTLDILPIP